MRLTKLHFLNSNIFFVLSLLALFSLQTTETHAQTWQGEYNFGCADVVSELAAIGKNCFSGNTD